MASSRRRKPQPGIKAFDVSIKRKGKEKIVSPFPLVFGEALALGRAKTKAGAAATFRLVPKQVKKVRTLGIKKITPEQLIGEYRKPIKAGREIKDPLTFIQKAPYRIKTKGEIKEITMLGWKAPRRKGRGKFVW